MANRRQRRHPSLEAIDAYWQGRLEGAIAVYDHEVAWIKLEEADHPRRRARLVRHIQVQCANAYADYPVGGGDDGAPQREWKVRAERHDAFYQALQSRGRKG